MERLVECLEQMWAQCRLGLSALKVTKIDSIRGYEACTASMKTSQKELVGVWVV